MVVDPAWRHRLRLPVADRPFSFFVFLLLTCATRSYFQCGVSNFLLGRYDLAYKDFEEALLYLRGNQAINYEQLGLQFRLYSAEVLFNKGLCHIYLGMSDRQNSTTSLIHNSLGNEAEGLQDMEEARKEKVTEEHKVIDEAIRDRGDDYTVFSIVSSASWFLKYTSGPSTVSLLATG